MPDDSFELRSISWSRTFPFVRLFRTFRFAALNAGRLLLGLACVLCCYVSGRILDGLWPESGRVVGGVTGTTVQTEIEAYAAWNTEAFETWKRNTSDVNRQTAAKTLVDLKKAGSIDEARQKLEGASFQDIVADEAYQQELDKARELVDARVESGLAALDEETQLSAAAKAERRAELLRAGDYLRLVLAGRDTLRFGTQIERSMATERVANADPKAEAAARIDHLAMLRRIVAWQQQRADVDRRRSRGPFISLVKYESRCFAAAVQAVCAGRWGLAGGATDPQPALAGCLASAGRGCLWLVTQRPWYALFSLALFLLITSFFAGAICRSTAIQSARDEAISVRTALSFARAKYVQLLSAPLVPVAFFVAVALLLWLGGVVGAIPVLGTFLASLFYFLALIGGLALALILVGTLLGFNLLWPTIAVEASDAFDALSHAASYVAARIWHAGFYALVLLLYGGISFVMVRLIAVLVLKLTHGATNAGMSLFGSLSSAHTDTFTKLEAMWRMPSWQDLALLPAVSDVPFWGTFANAPLSGSETVGMCLIAFWVFLVVGLVGAFVLNFFLCGSTEMYYLLRREVDATDFEEVYFEEPTEEVGPPATAAAGEATAGVSLPVAAPEQSPGPPPSA